MAIRNIGVLWTPKKEGSNCKLTGSIDLLGEHIRIGIFTNDRREKDTDPAYRIVRFLDDEKPQNNEPSDVF